MVFRLIIFVYVFAIPKPIFYILFCLFCVFETIRAWFLWPITYAVFGFFMNLTTVVIIESEMFYYAFLCSFELFCSFRCSCAFYCSSALTLLTVSSIMTLFLAIYVSSIFEPLFLLWRLLKCLLLLESIVWLFLLWLLSIGILIFRFLRLFVALHILRLSHSTEIYWFQSFISLS